MTVDVNLLEINSESKDAGETKWDSPKIISCIAGN